MKRFLILILALIFILSGCGQDSDGGQPVAPTDKEGDKEGENDPPADLSPEPVVPINYDFGGEEYITFLSSEPSQLNVDSFKAEFLNSKYRLEDAEYKEFYNYMPRYISAKYNIDAFKVIYNRGEYTFAEVYIRHNGRISPVDPFGTLPHDNSGFVHFAMTDLNSDGYYELLSSYGSSSTSRAGDKRFSSYITVIDSKTDNYKRSIIPCYDGFIYFKPNEEKRICAYVSEMKDIVKATTLYTEFEINNYKYEFLTENFSMESENYKVDVTIGEDTINFPVLFQGSYVTFIVNIKMTYLGETFTYTNPTGYCNGAEPLFKNSENEIHTDPWFETDVESTFTIKTGQVIERTYEFSRWYNSPEAEGVYDLCIEYRGEEICKSDFLTVKVG